MASFPNSMGIDTIKMGGIAERCFCPIGQTWCTYNISIEMTPGDIICDYLEVQEFLKTMPHKVTLEECAANVCTHMKTYEPVRVTVSVSCNDASHFPVVVAKHYFVF